MARAVVCGEAKAFSQAEGNAEAAIRFALQQLCDELAKTHKVDVLYAYPGLLLSRRGKLPVDAVLVIYSPASRLSLGVSVETARRLPSWNLANLDSRFHIVILACLVAIVCYQADRLVHVLGTPPEHIASWSFWPATPVLIAVLLLAPKRIWPVLTAAGLGAMVLADLKNGVATGFEIWMFLGNVVEVFVAMLVISLLFKGVPHLSSVKALAKYSAVVVILAPLVSAFVGANARMRGGYWLTWRLWFFSDALAFLTVTPAILSWAREGRAWARKSGNYVELAALLTSLALVGYLAFMGTWRRDSPALLYLLVPLLLWAAWRLGLKGVSTSTLVVAFLAIWGAAHDRGPFAGQGSLNNALSLQLFLFFAAIPFMFLAVLVKEQKRAQEDLYESEQRFRLVASTAPVMIWMFGPDKRCTYFNQTWLDFTGRPLEVELGGWLEGVHPDDRQRCVDADTQAVERRQPLSIEFRLRRHDGEYRWVLDSYVPRFNPDGSFAGFIGSVIDITERKLAEEAISKVNQKLIEAHEEERSLVARELHDDINQRLALLALNLERLQHNLPSSKAEIMQDIAEAGKQVQGLGSDVQALSHHLHSSKLEYLGLAAAAAGFCREVSNQQGVEIDFHSENIPKDLPKEASLCLFRVLQEAIQNAIKHSGSRHFEVSLSDGPSEIQLTVRDSGIGFDPEEAMKGTGLGLTSISERLKLVNGDLSVDSQPQRGTTIRARVPLSYRVKAAGASESTLA